MKKYEKWLSYSVIGGIFLLLLTPFVVATSMYFPYVSGKGFYFRIIVELISLFYVVICISNVSLRPKLNITHIVIILLLVTFLISNILSPNPYKSFLSNYERMDGYINLVHLALLFFVVSQVFTKKIWRWFLNSSLIVAFFVNMYAFLQLAGAIKINQGGVRVDGPLGNATYLSVYVLLNIGIALFLMAKRKTNVVIRFLYAISILLNFIVMYHTATRGAMLGFIVALISAPVYIALVTKGKKLLTLSAGIVCAVVVLGGGFLNIKDTQFVQSSPVLSRFAHISLSDSTTQSRFKIWNMAWTGVKEKPIFGWGQESFNYVFNANYNPSMWNQEQWFDRTHNVVLDWFVTGGAVGGILYLSLFFISLYYIFKRDDFNSYEKTALVGLIVAYGIQNLFVFDNPVSYMYWFLIIAFIAGKKINNEDTADMGVNSIDGMDVVDTNKSFVFAVSIIAFIAIIFGSYVFTYKPIRASQYLISGMQEYGNYKTNAQLSDNVLQSSGGDKITRKQIPDIIRNPQIPDEIKNIISKYKNGNPDDKLFSILRDASIEKARKMKSDLEYSINLNTFGTPEIREQISQLGTQILSDQNFPSDIKGEMMTFATNQMQEHALSAPKDARRQLIAGMTFRQLGDPKKAIEYIKKALALSPQKQTIFIELGAAYLQDGNIELAAETWKNSYELDHDYIQTGILYAVGQFYLGKRDEGQNIISELIAKGKSNEKTVYENQQLIGSFAETKDYENLIKFWSWRVEENPKDINNMISLAASYLEDGQKEKAISQIEKAIEIDPTFADRGNQYISDIKAGKRPN